MKYIRYIFLGFGFIAVLIGLVISAFLVTDKWVIPKYGNSKTDFFDALAGVSTTVATIGGLLILIITFFTYWETRKQRISREEPTVSLRLVPDEKNSNFLNVSLKNSGGGPAYDLRAHFSPDLPYENITLNQLSMFRRLPLLDAGEEIMFFYDSIVDYMRYPNNPKSVTATVTYFTLPEGNRSAKPLFRTFELNFEERFGQRQIIKKDMSNLVNEIEELKNVLLITSLKRGDSD
ncbi:hypothetical protein NLX67_21245 [Domibacillus sp. A3M-37]|uniref:hypothetical protein n=1 Tax=Domibacillus sp. A3M-37 TaxID=2962037 RepID=UPI0020B72D02|nr:hypothetical protein [Domibacillus sp. A3M-37]MCP3764849.1 hypothetical protein [Domibacillus sp. A3M-37]